MIFFKNTLIINVVYKLYNYLPTNRFCSPTIFMMCLMLYYVEEKVSLQKTGCFD